MEIILASTNPHKIREFKELFKSLTHLHDEIDLLSLHQFQDYVAPEETGVTFRENAILKAEYAAKRIGRWVIADDSGLVVPALNGEPGVYSSRYAGAHATDLENQRKLLESMSHLRDLERIAYFECCIAIASPVGLKKCVTGVCEGIIIEESRGRNGFGYDALFIKNDYDKTFAQLDDNIKNRISHRCKAFERLRSFFEHVEASQVGV